MNEHDDINHFNPERHVKAEHQPYVANTLCSCSWVGYDFKMHRVAMQVAHDVLVQNVIEEEP